MIRILGELDELSRGIETLAALEKLAKSVADVCYPDVVRAVAYWVTFIEDGTEHFAFTVNYNEDN